MTIAEKFEKIRDYLDTLEPKNKILYCQAFSAWWGRDRPKITKNMDALMDDLETCDNVAQDAIKP